MKIRKQILYAICIGFIFLVLHMFMAQFQFDNLINFIVTALLMLLAQLAAFSVLRKKTAGTHSFKSLLIFLCLVQCMSVIFLTLNAALNPYEPDTPFILIEVLISLLIFGILFPALVTTIIWFIMKKKDTIS